MPVFIPPRWSGHGIGAHRPACIQHPGNAATLFGMTTGPTLPERPQLRPIEVSRVSHEGSDFFLLKDPRHLSEQSLVVPALLGPYLQNIDGTNTIGEITDAALSTGAQPVPPGVLSELVGRLDEVFLLANGSYTGEMQRRLNEYRNAPARKSALADLAYPGRPDDLRAYLDGLAFPYMLDTEDLATGGQAPDDMRTTRELKAILSPHIDFERGGDSYAMIWEQVRSELREVELFVVFGTDHNGDGPRLTLTNQNYESPIGGLETDRELVGELAKILSADESIDDHPFADEFNHVGEHSIELASVWLHRAVGSSQAKMLPVLCGSLARALPEGGPGVEAHPQISSVIGRLKDTAGRRRTVFIAAADLSHVGPAFGDPEPSPPDSNNREQVRMRDEQLLAAFAEGDRLGFMELIRSDLDSNRVCGLAPIYMTLWAAGASTGVWNGYQQCQADENDTSFVSIAGAALYG